MFLLTACRQETVPPESVEYGFTEEALLRGPATNKAALSESTCSCEYEVINVSFTPPSTGPGDHLEFHFFADELCDPSLSPTYFSAFFGDCTSPSLGPETDFFPSGTYSSGGYHPFHCEVPSYDGFELDFDMAKWYLGGCIPQFQEPVDGTIEYRIRCNEEPAAGEPTNCKGQIFVSNIMFSDFTVVNGITSYLDNRTVVYIGAVLTDGGDAWELGCGCEPIIAEIL